MDDPAARARALAVFIAAAATIGATSVATSTWLDAAPRLTALGLVAFGYALAAASWRIGARLPRWAPLLLMGVVSLLITIGIQIGGEVPNQAAMIYVVPAVYCAAFLPLRDALAQLLLISGLFAAALVIAPASGSEAQRWTATMATLLVTVGLIRYLRLQHNASVEEHEQAEERLERSVSLHEATLQSTADGILVVDLEGRAVSFNRKFVEMWDIPAEMVKRANDEEILAHAIQQLEDPAAAMQRVAQLYSDPGASSLDLVRFRDGRVFERLSQPHRLGLEIVGRVWSFRDVTELRQLTDYDPLTTLLNRRRFEEELAHQAAQASPEGRGAVLVLDVDDFKLINDNAGHRAGDEVLRSIAELLRGTVGPHELVARLSGDEFAVLLPGCDAEDAARRALELLETIRRHRVLAGGQAIRITASIGGALYGEDPANGEELLVRADVAMYQAKETGRDRFVMYAPEMQAAGPAEIRPGALDRLRAAIEEERFTLASQPIVELVSGVPAMHELLIRMIADDGRVIPPAAFLPVAERFGLTTRIDRWVTAKAMRLLAAEARAGRRPRLAVNLSAQSLADPDLPSFVARELASTGAEPGRLVFEITETAAIGNLGGAERQARQLRELGCRLSLDDFGAGFASFYYLKFFETDYLKIDGEFIRDLTSNTVDRALVHSIVRLARSLGKETIAEYVGDAETQRLLLEEGVTCGQGFYLGRPQPVEAVFGDSWAALGGVVAARPGPTGADSAAPAWPRPLSARR